MQAQVPAMRRLSTAMFLDPGLAPAAPGLAPAAPPAPPGVLRSEQLAGCQEGITVDERVMQQLRGIFAAHDSDKDLMLSEAQLSDAVRALGFTPSADLQARFMARRPQDMQGSGLIDLTTFLLVATEELKRERRFCSDAVELFELFDPEQSGTVSASTLRHILHETLTPERLSQAELEEFLEYAGLRKQGGYGAGMRSTRVDYHQLLDKLMI